MSRIDRIEEAYARTDLPKFKVGNTVDVHVLIKEGEKERIQIFSGTVIRMRGHGMSATFTVRRIVQSEGVERIFPMHSPFVKKVDVKRVGRVRRAKLYFLRDRTGKATRLKEVIDTRRKTKAKAKKAAKAAQAAVQVIEPETGESES
ncbi:MAG: 50S ribosomal protein L19 [Planctomycetota bacterium]